MNLECHVCTARKIATSFHSLDDFQAHLFGNHHDGPLEVFQFVCRNCEFKFATEYRILRHEETCGNESRNAEDMEKIRYKLQIYELLEESLTHNLTKSQTSSVLLANAFNIETSGNREVPQTQYQTESPGSSRIKAELPELLEKHDSNLRQENSVKNGSDQNYSTDSATNTKLNAKNLETSEWSIPTFEWTSDLIYLSDKEYVKEIKSDPPSLPKRLTARRKSLLSINSKFDLVNLSSSDSENEKPAPQKAHHKSKTTKAPTKNKETSTQSSIKKKNQIGSFVFSDSSDGSFIEFRKSKQLLETPTALQNDCAQLEMSKENNFTSSNYPEEAHSTANSDTNKELSNEIIASAKPKLIMSGRLELLKMKFIEWSFFLHYDRRHVLVSKLFSIGGYPFHIEINSNPLAGHPGQGNEYIAPFYRRFGILLVCDYAFPDPTLRLASNFVITLKAKDSNFTDYKTNCSTVYSAWNRTGGSLAASEFVVNPVNGLLHQIDTLYITIDVFIAS